MRRARMRRGLRRARRARVAMLEPPPRPEWTPPPETGGARLQRAAMAACSRCVYRCASDVRGARLHGAGEDRPSRRPPRSARASRSLVGQPCRPLLPPPPRDHLSPGRRVGDCPRGRRRLSRARRCAETRRAASGSGRVRVAPRGARRVAPAPCSRRRARAVSRPPRARPQARELATPRPGPRARVCLELECARPGWGGKVRDRVVSSSALIDRKLPNTLFRGTGV